MVPRTVALPLTASLARPFGSVAQRFQQSLIAAIQAGDGGHVIRVLLESSRELSPAERSLACLVPCTIGLAERQEAGSALPGSAAILKFVRESARAMLAKFPLAAQSIWLVPCTPEDLTAAHLAAVLMAQRGQLARPWIWPLEPRSGAFVVVGTTAVAPQHRWQALPIRQTSLIAECRALPVDVQWASEHSMAHAG